MVKQLIMKANNVETLEDVDLLNSKELKKFYNILIDMIKKLSGRQGGIRGFSRLPINIRRERVKQIMQVIGETINDFELQ
jgi:hypothetical protein